MALTPHVSRLASSISVSIQLGGSKLNDVPPPLRLPPRLGLYIVSSEWLRGNSGCSMATIHTRLWCPHWNDHTQGHSCVVAPSDGLIRVAKDVAANVKVILAVTALIHPTLVGDITHQLISPVPAWLCRLKVPLRCAPLKLQGDTIGSSASDEKITALVRKVFSRTGYGRLRACVKLLCPQR